MPRTLLDRLAEQFPSAKKQTLRRMAAAGRVVVNGRPAYKVNVVLGDADRVETTDAPAKPRRPTPPPGGGLLIVYEDDDLLVVNKPAGLLTSTTPGEWRPTLLAQVREYVAAADRRARVGLIHRLDRDAAGLLVFSRNDAAYHALKTQIFHHHVERVYSAVVHGVPVPQTGRIESRLVERTDGTVHSTRQIGKGQEAVTAYEVVRSGGKKSLLRVTLHTGRKHQIRVHLSEKGWPIVGDPVYGRPGELAQRGGLLLAATKLAIDHPRTGRRVTFEVPAAFEAAGEWA